MLTPVVDWAIQEAEVHLQLVDIVRRRRVSAAASLAAHTVLVADVSAVPEHGGVLDVFAGSRLGLEDLPALLELSALLFRSHNYSELQQGRGHQLVILWNAS